MMRHIPAMASGGLLLALFAYAVTQDARAQAVQPEPLPVQQSPLNPPVQPPPVQPLPLQPPPRFQPVTADRIVAALRLDGLADILAAEVAASGDPLGFAGPDAAQDDGWARIVVRIAPPHRIRTGLRAGITAEAVALTDPAVQADLADALAFWESPLGQRTLELEHSARLALTDAGAETAARAAFDRAAARSAPRADQIRRLIEVADLVEPAVAASLNIALASMQGIRDSGGFPADDADLAQDVWLQEPEIRAAQAGWLEALLFLSTGPLTDAEVERLIAAAAKPGAQGLNRIVDAAATAVFVGIAHDLGLAAAQRQAGQRL